MFFLDKVPLWGPRGSGLDQNCTCTTRPWGQQNVTINRSLRYLVTEEIEEQDIVYGQTDKRVSHKLDLSSTSRAKNQMCLWNTYAPERQQSQNLAVLKSYILAPPHPKGDVMSVKPVQRLHELTVKFCLLYHHPNFNISHLKWRWDGSMDRWTDRQRIQLLDAPNGHLRQGIKISKPYIFIIKFILVKCSNRMLFHSL